MVGGRTDREVGFERYSSVVGKFFGFDVIRPTGCRKNGKL